MPGTAEHARHDMDPKPIAQRTTETASVAEFPEPFYRAICESMTTGVMLIDGDGRIETFNPAAAALLGLERKAVLNRSFADVFVSDAAFEEFSDVVFSAVYDGLIGNRRTVSITPDGRPAALAIDTSYLRVPVAGRGDRRAVVAVFSDVSELEDLRANEAALARDVQTKHEELREAYRSLEARNSELGGLLRKVRAVRIVAAVCGTLLLLGGGAYLWDESAETLFGTKQTHATTSAAAARVFTVATAPIVSTITVSSEIEPRRKITVSSPVQGQVEAIHAKLGESVAAGQPLLDLDVTDFRNQRRKAQAAFLTAKAKVDTLADWANSSEAARARRSVTKARIALEASNTKLAEIDFLVGQGLAPAVQKRTAERELRSRQLDLESAEQDLEAVLAKEVKARRIAELELENARADLQRIDQILRNARVVAPVDGVVLRLGAGSRDVLWAGTSVKAGEHLVTIGNMEGITASGRVDEVQIRRIRLGQKVRISGPAFPGVVLEGRIALVSSHASRPLGQQRVPTFKIAAAVDRLNEAQGKAVRLGMSADMEIVVYENDRALVVPVGAVEISGDRRIVRVVQEATGAVRTVEVETGTTSLDSVEILSGLARGDKIVAP